jgi:hypothetical protein
MAHGKQSSCMSDATGHAVMQAVLQAFLGWLLWFFSSPGSAWHWRRRAFPAATTITTTAHSTSATGSRACSAIRNSADRRGTAHRILPIRQAFSRSGSSYVRESRPRHLRNHDDRFHGWRRQPQVDFALRKLSRQRRDAVVSSVPYTPPVPSSGGTFAFAARAIFAASANAASFLLPLPLPPGWIRPADMISLAASSTGMSSSMMALRIT